MSTPTPLKKTTFHQLEKNLFEIICLIALVVMLHGMIQGAILFGANTLTYIQGAISILMIVIYYFSRFRGKFELLRVPLVILINILLIFFWFWLSGIYGPTGVAAVAVGIITIILIPTKLRVGFLLGSSVIIISLVVIQIQTDLVQTNLNDYGTLPFDYLVVLFGILLIIFYLKVEFDKERTVVLEQNKDLEYLNAELIKSVTEKEAIIRQLKSTQQKLVESEKMASIGRLTGGLAHELNNPLNFIGGNITPIKKDLEEIKTSLNKSLIDKNEHLFEEINDLLQNIQEGSRQATGIIENLVRIDPASKEIKDQNFDLTDLVNRTFRLVQNANPEIRFSLITSDSIRIFGNIVEINQVIINVLKNAIEAVSACPEPEISLLLNCNENICKIQVTDNGTGIPKKIRPHIFEPFYSTKKDEKGAGLGLYISYGILKKHGGNIYLDSKYKEGARVLITLPIADN